MVVSECGVDMDGVARRLFSAGDKLAFEALHPDRKERLGDAAKEIMCHAIDEMTLSRMDIPLGKACHKAFYSVENKGVYPFGCSGKIGLHSDLLNFVLCIFDSSTGQDVYEALLAHQFMARNTLEIVEFENCAPSWLTAQTCAAVCRDLEKLPRATQEYLAEWKATFLDPKVAKGNKAPDVKDVNASSN